MLNNDSFTGYVVVKKGTKMLLHWVVYQRKEDAMTEATEWLPEDYFEIIEIKRRMRI